MHPFILDDSFANFCFIILFVSGVLVIRPDSGNPAEVVVKILNILCKLNFFISLFVKNFFPFFHIVNVEISVFLQIENLEGRKILKASISYHLTLE